MIETKAAGKLYIAGEYAVVEPGYKAILASVDRYIYVSLEEADDCGSITSYDNSPIAWKRENGRLVLDKRDNRLSYIIASIKTVESYARELGIKLSFYHLKVVSEMESREGKKFGLGSSAAVTVATIDALCRFYGIETSKLDLFKLSSIAQLSINDMGSCGDIAASVFGGLISYSSYDRNWVIDRLKNTPIKDLLEMDWPKLEINYLPIPRNFHLLIGWTGSPASTAHLVDRVKDKKENKDEIYNDFLEKSQALVNRMIKGFKEENVDLIQENIAANRRLLKSMGESLNVLIETESLSRLCEIAKSYEAFAKSSGAGGGDCGIAILKSEENIDKIISKWKENNIIHLPIKINKKR